LGPGQDGTKAALPAWARFMREAHDTLDLKIINFPIPDGIIQKEICSLTKKKPQPGCPLESEVFKSGTEPAMTCQVHRTG